MAGQPKRPEYKEIKDYIREILEAYNNGDKTTPIVLYDSTTREVLIKSLDENYKERPRAYRIPQPNRENLFPFHMAWVDVYLGCLDYYKQKLRKEGIVIVEYEN